MEQQNTILTGSQQYETSVFCCKSQQGFIMKDLKGLRTTVGIPYVIKITQTVHSVYMEFRKREQF